MPFTPEQHRAYRRQLAARGICTHCHRRDAAPSYRQCDPCRTNLLSDLKRRKAEWRTDPERCPDCGGHNDRGPHTYYCTKCRTRSSRYNRALYKRRRESKRCTKCGIPLPKPDDSFFVCGLCAQDQAERQLLHRSLD